MKITCYLLLFSAVVCDAGFISNVEGYFKRSSSDNQYHKREVGHSDTAPPKYEENGEPLFHIQDNNMGVSYDTVNDADMSPPKPGSGNAMNAAEEDPQVGPTLLRTKLAVNQDAHIFASYVRDFASMEKRFNDQDQYSVVMAPSDEAVEKLGAKPWEFPQPIDSSKSEKERDKIAKSNVRSFLNNHLHYGDFGGQISILGQDEPKTFELSTEAGTNILVEPKDDKLKLTTSDGIVATVYKAEKVDNGAIWILDRALVSP